MKFEDFVQQHSVSITYAQWVRFRYVERQLLWERSVTSGMVADTFHVSKQQARKDIAEYSRITHNIHETAPGEKTRTFRPHVSFNPFFLGEDDLVWESTPTIVPPSSPNISPCFVLKRKVPVKALCSIQAAIEGSHLIRSIYASTRNPGGIDRDLLPLKVVNAHGRFHLRAVDLDDNDLIKDFVVTRFLSEIRVQPDVIDKAVSDVDWDTLVPIRVVPNPINGSQFEALMERDYLLPKNHIMVRKAMLGYFLSENRLPVEEKVDQISSEVHGRIYPLVAYFGNTEIPAYHFGFSGKYNVQDVRRILEGDYSGALN
ncbi:hypothetical protein [Neptuniibacter pectenicola]|uniref:WYL domain-containing protein n=1 Tax=Neptuniibacter pectenicola TaxID=1806669 RepID=UPI0030EB627B